jgi:UDP-glucose 4-epimerase
VVYAASCRLDSADAGREPVSDDAYAHPQSPYAVTKQVGELYLKAYAQIYDMSPISLALASVYGPRQSEGGDAGLVASICSAVLNGRPVTAYREGLRSRDYVYVDDVVSALVCAGLAPEGTKGTYQVSSGRSTSASDIHRLVSVALGVVSEPAWSPKPIDRVRAAASSTLEVERDLGWRPVVGLAEGLRHTVHWLREMREPQPAVLVTA